MLATILLSIFGINGIALGTENFTCLFDAFLVVEFHPEYAVFLFPVMNDTDVFDTDLMQCQDRGNGGESTGLIRNLNIEGIGFLDRPTGGIDKGITVISCFVKKMIKRLTACVVNLFFNLLERVNVIAKQG